MKFEIIKQTRNELLHREEFIIQVAAAQNPTKEDIINFIKKDSEVCVVKEIQGNFGRDIFEVSVFVYDSPELREKTEYLPRKIRKKLEEERKKAEEAKAKAEEEAKKKAEEEAKAKEAEEKKAAEQSNQEEELEAKTGSESTEQPKSEGDAVDGS